MYCIQCGVKLADTEKRCPLCGTVPYHPDIPAKQAAPLYPTNRYPAAGVDRRKILAAVSTMLALLPMIIVLLCNLQINGAVTWSGYVIGAVPTAYVACILPLWFKKPNPVIFVPCTFAAVAVYVLYIDLYTGGGWFLGFAFPVIGFFGIVVTAVVTLLRYVRKGKLYIFGGAAIAVGAFMPILELLTFITFRLSKMFAWSLYPLVAFILLGSILIFLAICRPARQTMERKFFI